MWACVSVLLARPGCCAISLLAPSAQRFPECWTPRPALAVCGRPVCSFFPASDDVLHALLFEHAQLLALFLGGGPGARQVGQ